ncbi:MAG: hypothetical protein J6Q82_07285 [Clostridia bacterium]|nr:hypothetical protein [Clostridia bacterium]
MMGTVLVRSYDAPLVRRDEILRYAGVRGTASEIEPLLVECLAEVESALTYSVCYSEFPIVERDGTLEFGFLTTESRDLKKALTNCSSGIVFAATVGISLDRMIHRASTTSPTKALLLQAIGAERIEALCDLFCDELRREQSQFRFRPRVSPGYGDIPIELQKNIFALLDCPKRIGLSLNQSLILSPSKSVTAFVGREEIG